MVEALDTNYSATQAEKNYVQESFEKNSIKEFFIKEAKNLKEKIINNFHTENYSNFEQKMSFEQEKQTMKNILKKPIYRNIYNQYSSTLAKNQNKPGFSEGIALLQSIINVYDNKKGKSSSHKIDGIVGPKTFEVLASIAKEANIKFDGIIDKSLLTHIIGVCNESGTREVQQEETYEKKMEKMDKNIKKLHNQLNKIDPKYNKNVYISTMKQIDTIVKQKEFLMDPEEIEKELKTIEQNIQELEKIRTKKNEYTINSQINYLSMQKKHLTKLFHTKENNKTIQEKN